MCFFFFQAEDGIRDLVRSRGLGDVYKRQVLREHEKLFLIRLSNKISTRTKTKNMATIIFAGKSIAGNA